MEKILAKSKVYVDIQTGQTFPITKLPYQEPEEEAHVIRPRSENQRGSKGSGWEKNRYEASNAEFEKYARKAEEEGIALESKWFRRFKQPCKTKPLRGFGDCIKAERCPSLSPQHGYLPCTTHKKS